MIGRRTKSTKQIKGSKDAKEAAQPSEGVTQTLERVTQAHVGHTQGQRKASKGKSEISWRSGFLSQQG